jgi:CRISPR-associated protein Csm4
VKIYRITIEPRSPFGTPLKGDTLFGQFCWQAAYAPDLLTVPLDEAIRLYSEKPFAVFSSAFPSLLDGGIALKRPDAPLDLLFDFSGKSREDIIGDRKKFKKQKWLLCDKAAALADFRTCEYMDDEELTLRAGLKADKHSSVEESSHNSVSRLTGTTGGNGFAPFTQENTVYAPGGRLAVFVGIDEGLLPLETLKTGLERIGLSGFGRDASTGLGKFTVTECTEVDLAAYGPAEPNALYTLSPSVPKKAEYKDALFTPFTRFGRHGDRLATSGKPFKNPVIMADEGALYFPHDMGEALQRPYMGSALAGLSKIQENAVAQGYSLYIPVRLEVV